MSNIKAVRRRPYSKTKMANKFFKSTQKILVSFACKLSKTIIKAFKLSKKAIQFTTGAIRRRKCQPKVKNIKFSVFVIEVDNTKSGWQKLVSKVIKSAEGVRHFQMDGRGFVLISGFVDPESLLKALEKAGSKVKLHDWRFGECCTDLFGPVLEMYPKNLPRITNG